MDINPKISSLVDESEKKVEDVFKKIDKDAEYHQFRVIRAMQNAGLSERHFLPSSGYGYSDPGREVLEAIFSDLFHTGNSLVRPHISSGTHAIACALYGNLRPGDELLSITGDPYETVLSFIGDTRHNGKGTLADYGVSFKKIDLVGNHINEDEVLKKITPKTKMVYLQRSCGYHYRRPLDFEEVRSITKKVREVNPDTVFFLDNCYGEFIGRTEPADYGIDLLAGSLIKNPGGGLAPTGGYITGREDLITNAGSRLSAPGVEIETGATLGFSKTALQGLFLAPVTTANALKSAVLAAQVFSDLGYEVSPGPKDDRSDLIQIIKLNDKQKVIDFCRAIQSAAPVDAHVVPEPWPMPGYKDEVIMAAGAFIQGSSIELSADAPIREPYNVYFQGGLTYPHGKYGVLLAAQVIER